MLTRITLDDAASNQLHELTEAVELCDRSGRVLGQFVPVSDMAVWEPASPEIDQEELDGRQQSTEWYTTEQVLARLRGAQNQ